MWGSEPDFTNAMWSLMSGKVCEHRAVAQLEADAAGRVAGARGEVARRAVRGVELLASRQRAGHGLGRRRERPLVDERPEGEQRDDGDGPDTGCACGAARPRRREAGAWAAARRPQEPPRGQARAPVSRPQPRAAPQWRAPRAELLPLLRHLSTAPALRAALASVEASARGSRSLHPPRARLRGRRLDEQLAANRRSP